MQERNPLISTAVADSAVSALVDIAAAEKAEPKVRLQAAQTLLGSAYLYDYPGLTPSGDVDDEPEPDRTNTRALDGPEEARPEGSTVSLTVRVRSDALGLLTELAARLGGDLLEARIGPWYG